MLEVGVGTTGISSGTTIDTIVDVTNAKDVMHTRPWYRPFCVEEE